MAAYKSAPQSVKAYVKLANPDSDFHAAYRLGELKFAQLVAAQAERRRSSKDFEHLVLSGQTRRIAEALREERLSNKDLARHLSVTTEHLSRVLARLREEGVTDFVRHGTSTINFLTPVAEAVLEGALSEAAAPMNDAVVELMQKLSEETDDEYKDFPSFGNRNGEIPESMT
jgi:DNA-binding MarR family transcriptional regulator